MSAEKFKCIYCQYESLKKYNLYRHTVAKHKNNNYQNLLYPQQNLLNSNQNLLYPQQNLLLENEKEIKATQCEKCNKTLSSKQSLNRHLKICKGTINGYICHLCNKKFEHYNTKYYHVKKCKGISNELILSKEKNEEEMNKIIKNGISNEITINENTTNNIINNKQNNCNNNNTYNINLIIYDKENDTIDFDLKHLNFDFVYKLTSRNQDDAFKYYCEKLFENKNNQMIIKSNLRNKYSKIHIGSNVWENFLDQHIYPKMMSLISETMITYINEHSKNKKNIKQLDHYLQIMASDGYSNSETLEYKKKYKNNIDMLKILFNTFM